MNFLQKLSLKHQVWIGLTLMLLMTAIVAISSLVRLNQVQAQATFIAHEAQPAMVSALKLQDSINASASYMALYIINPNAEYKDIYKNGLQNISEEMDVFANLPLVQNDKSLHAQYLQLKQFLNEYMSMQQQVESLTSNSLDNFPGVKLSSIHLNPTNKQIFQIFENMINSELEEIASSERRIFLLEITSLRHNWNNIVSSLRGFYANTNDQNIEQVQLYMSNHLDLLKKLNEQSDEFTFEQEEGFDFINSKTKEYFETINKIFTIHKAGQWRNDQTLIKDQIRPAMNKIHRILHDIVTDQGKQTRSASGHLLEQTNNTQSFIIGLFIIASIIGAVIAISNSRQINTLITEVTESLNRMSTGDLSVNLDEGRIGEVGQISTLINRFSKQLNTMIINLKSATDELQHASSQLSSVTQETSHSITQQHGETSMVAAAVEEMTATAQEIAHNTASAAESAKQADAQSRQGALVSSEAMGGMFQLVGDLNKASEVIQSLQSESSNINVVLDVISGISQQTNLLALNAAIEAARAGEQGRGFAVVADEVRTLAGRTQDSTNQIKLLIDSLQAGSSNAVEVMNNAIKEVNINNEQVENVAEALGGIAGEIGSINGMLDQMAAASEEQSATSLEISRNVSSISALADQTAQGTSHINSAEADISAVSKRLNTIISSFKTA